MQPATPCNDSTFCGVGVLINYAIYARSGCFYKQGQQFPCVVHVAPQPSIWSCPFCCNREAHHVWTYMSFLSTWSPLEALGPVAKRFGVLPPGAEGFKEACRRVWKLPTFNRVCCFGCLKGRSKSVQVVLNGIEAVLILTLISLK